VTTLPPPAPDRAVAVFHFGARPVLRASFPPSSDLPDGALADVVAKVEAIWQRLAPIQAEGRELIKQRPAIHREDERKRQEAAAAGRKLPASALEKADQRLLELADQVRPLRDAYEAAQRRVTAVDAAAWQQAVDADGEQVQRDHQAVIGAVASVREAFDALRTSSQRRRWAASRGRHPRYAPEPTLLDGHRLGTVLDALASVPDRLAEPPQVESEPDRVLMLPGDSRRSARRSAAEAS
jgi:hypothetical protein